MSRTAKPFRPAIFFAALADTTRLRLLNLMATHEVCVCHFVDILGQSQPKISRHLAYLRRAGIVAARREGKWMHYSICTPGESSGNFILAAVLHTLSSDKQMSADRIKLERICRAPRELIVVETAPSPVA
jgi:ArsR family transcriptional regulator